MLSGTKIILFLKTSLIIQQQKKPIWQTILIVLDCIGEVSTVEMARVPPPSFICGPQKPSDKYTQWTPLTGNGECIALYVVICVDCCCFFDIRFCDGHAAKCQSTEPVRLELEVISLQPRAFVIMNFLSDFEADAIIKLASPQVKESTVGNNDGGGVRKSTTRTSFNTWINRKTSDVTETISRRAADLLNIDEKLLNAGVNAEELQVIHYGVGQKYDAHHDWGVNGYAESRYITLLFYLNNMKHPDAGGETSFPKAAGGRGIKVHPGKGSAVLFYNLLEDGNADDLSLHEATPPRDGEKWLANYWIWDPKRR